MDENTDNNDLEVRHFRIRPTWHLSYLYSPASITFALKNNTNEIIELESIICSFDTIESFPPCEISIDFTTPIIPPSDMCTYFSDEFSVDLRLKPRTNIPTLTINYIINKTTHKTIQRRMNSPDSRRFIIYNVEPSPRHTLFLSHKDPENIDHASILTTHLNKIGYHGYIAENDPKPGHHMWEEKIYPAIDNCDAVIVLWTKAAQKNPDNILREIHYAAEKGKKILFISEEGTNKPDIQSMDIEHIAINGNISETELVKIAEIIYKLYMAGDLD